MQQQQQQLLLLRLLLLLASRLAVQSSRSGPFCPASHDAFAVAQARLKLETIAAHAICRPRQEPGLGLGQVGCAMLLPAVCATAGAQLTGYLLGFAAQYSFGVLVPVLVTRCVASRRAYRSAAIENGFVSISTH